MGDEELAAIARTGVDVSFAEDERKAELGLGIDAWLADPGD